MSLTYNINRYDVIDLYHSLIKSYGKNIYFVATPTNEVYQLYSGNNRFNQEYQYKFCYNLDKVDLNELKYTSRNSFTCYYFRHDGKTEIKKIGNRIDVHSNQLTYSNANYKQVQNVPKSIENYGGVFNDAYTLLAFCGVAFVMCFIIVRSVFPRFR